MDIRHFYQNLHGLDAKLRAEGMQYGPDVWLLVTRLLERLQQQGRLPDDPSALAPLLGPLFCRYPEDQARFPAIFAEWLTGAPPAAAMNRVVSPQQQPIAGARANVRRAAWLWAGAGPILSGLLVAWIISHPVQETPIATSPAIQQPQPPPVEPPTPPPQDQPATPLDNRVPPRVLPEPLPKIWADAGEGLDQSLDVVPWALALIWLASRYHRHWILRTQAPEGGELLNHLHFKRLLAPLFGGAEAERALRELRAARVEPTRRLDIAATVEATARHGDYFQPVYANRRVAPEHLLLVQSAHRNDQQAALAEELAGRFRSLGLTVRVYRFRDDPRFLVRWRDRGGDYEELTRLAARHGASRLLVIGAAQLLFHPLSGEVRPWLDALKPWQDCVWLHPRDAGPEHAELLARHAILLLPLSRGSLPALVARLTGNPIPKGEGGAGPALDLPDMIAAEPDAWLGEKPPYDADLAGLARQLEHYLGSYGLRLLRAVAVYPRPLWDLTLALDYLLYGELGTADPPARREQRLSRLSRLPWLTHAHWPDWLRLCLLRGMDDDERQRIVTVWRSLFVQLTDNESVDSLRLDINTPSQRQIKLRLADLRNLRQPSQLDDPIFVNILLGGRLGLLDFALPRAIARLLPGGRWLVSLKPLLLALSIAGLSVWGGNKLWDVVGRDGLVAVSTAIDRRQNQGWTVSVNAGSDAQALMQAVNKRLQAAGFTTLDAANGSDGNSQNLDRLLYPPGGEAAARRVIDKVSHLTYGASIAMQQQTDLADHNLVLQLAHTHQAGAKFHDALAYPWKPGMAKPPPPPLPTGFSIPMVQITAGEFWMGSDETDMQAFKDEKPRHSVKVPAFKLGKTEVTQGQWRAVMGFNPSRFKQCGDNCPVETVSWNEVQAFIKTLNEKTGGHYRLPTEAEWEYAGRAGLDARYCGGDDADAVAWHDGNSDGTTHPVGSKQPNAFGLYDMSGNVWEWVQDCYHASYQGAPDDGSAWGGGAECRSRVLRGGAFNHGQLRVRCAYRNRSDPGNRYYYGGFRVVVSP
jgi:formylglycine-generating enzyme required for sulfatase activity